MWQREGGLHLEKRRAPREQGPARTDHGEPDSPELESETMPADQFDALARQRLAWISAEARDDESDDFEDFDEDDFDDDFDDDFEEEQDEEYDAENEEYPDDDFGTGVEGDEDIGEIDIDGEEIDGDFEGAEPAAEPAEDEDAEPTDDPG